MVLDYRVVVLFLMTVIFLCFWLFVFVPGYKQITNKIYSIFVGNMALWAFGLAMFYQGQDPKQILFWADFLYIAGSLIAAAFLHFSFVFPSGKMSISLFRQLLIYFPNVILFILFFFTPIIVKDVLIQNDVRGFIYGPGHILWDLQFTMAFGFGFWRFIKAYKTSSGITRNRLRYVLAGTLAGVLLAGTTNVIMPWFGRFELLWLAPVLTLTWLASIVYAIVRHRLLDIRVAISRTAIGAIIFGSLLSLPWLGSFLLQNFIIAQYRSFWWLVALGGDGLMILAFFGFRIYRYFQAGAEKTLRKEEFHSHDILLEMSKEVTLIKDLDQLLETLILRIVKDVRISNGCVYLKNEEGYLLRYGYGREKERLPQHIAKENALVELLTKYEEPVLREEAARVSSIEAQMKTLHASVLVPCFIKKGDLVGFLALGEKTSGQAYTQEDLEVFQTLSGYAALAIENAGHLKQLEALHVQALEAEKFRALRQMLNALSHEINNQLTRMIGPMQMITIQNKDKLDEELTKKLKGIWQEGMTAAEILHDVKRYRDKSESKELLEVEIETMIEGAWKKFSGLLDQMGVIVHKELASPLGKFRGRESFTELFYNLMKNSYFNLREPERKELWIEAHRNGKCVEVVIKDTGGDFSRVVCDDTTGGELFAERGKLGGVNLYLAQTIAWDTGIELKLESNQGIGVIFRVRIPLVETTPSGGG